MGLASFALIYVFGGLTFFPLLAVALLSAAYFSLPAQAESVDRDDRRKSIDGADGSAAEEAATKELVADLNQRESDSETASGYFAVTRQYHANGVSGKAPDKAAPSSDSTLSESPSVYQSMYRSVFERGKSTTPVLDKDSEADGKNDRTGVLRRNRPRNVFFIVLRHGHLMLYDSSEQIEVRHVISLAHHDIDMFAGGEPLQDGDLFIKRTSIRLCPRLSAAPDQPAPKPFYLFCENCSAKEDFYLSLLRSKASLDLCDVRPPEPIRFAPDDMIKLVQILHASSANVETRWLNALLGRLFLAIYKTSFLENLIHSKITKKISRVAKPAFISAVAVQSISLGDAAPVFSNPRLKELTIDGDLVIAADVKYNGGFKLQIAAVAKLDLGSRFKARTVDLVLAGILKRLSGHVLVKIKPPPSNRIWFTFAQVPDLDLSIEPVVSTRQITYTFILRAIENRIREVIADTLVLPNWDDFAFFDTTSQDYRGGIWQEASHSTPTIDQAVDSLEAMSHDAVDKDTESDDDVVLDKDMLRNREKTMSMPALVSGPSSPSALATGSSLFRANDAKRRSVVSVADAPLHSGSSTPETRDVVDKPRAMRSPSFTSPAAPTLSMEGANVERFTKEAPPTKWRGKQQRQKDAVEAIREMRDRAPPPSSTSSQPSSPMQNPTITEQEVEDDNASVHLSAEQLSETTDLPTEASTRSLHPSSQGKKTMLASTAAATAAARQWSWNAMNRRGSPSLPVSNEPLGRGQPLPPPGTPLPGPPKSLWASSGLGSLPGLGVKRKPLPPQRHGVPPELPARRPQSRDEQHSTNTALSPEPPPLPTRPTNRQTKEYATSTTGNGAILGEDESYSIERPDEAGDMMVIAAPSDSTPTSPWLEKPDEMEAPSISSSSALPNQEPEDDVPSEQTPEHDDEEAGSARDSI